MDYNVYIRPVIVCIMNAIITLPRYGTAIVVLAADAVVRIAAAVVAVCVAIAVVPAVAVVVFVVATATNVATPIATTTVFPYSNASLAVRLHAVSYFAVLLQFSSRLLQQLTNVVVFTLHL